MAEARRREAVCSLGLVTLTLTLALTLTLTPSPHPHQVHGFRADCNDFFHGWLNFQIEHHLWPQLSMLSYQKAAPEVRSS